VPSAYRPVHDSEVELVVTELPASSYAGSRVGPRGTGYLQHNIESKHIQAAFTLIRLRVRVPVYGL